MQRLTDQKAREILGAMPAHPKTDRIRVLDRAATDEDIKNIFWLLRAEFMDAAIIDAPNKHDIIHNQSALSPETWAVTDLPTDTDDLLYIPTTNKNYPLHTGIGKRIPLCDRSTLPDIAQQSLPHINQWIIQNEDLIPYTDYKSKKPALLCRLYMFHAAPGCGRDGRAPGLHFDTGIGVYTLFFGAGMEILTSPLNDKGKQDLTNIMGVNHADQFDRQVRKLTQIFGDAYDINDHLTTIQPGQMIIYNHNIWHRSSRAIAEKGQLAIDLSTYNLPTAST